MNEKMFTIEESGMVNITRNEAEESREGSAAVATLEFPASLAFPNLEDSAKNITVGEINQLTGSIAKKIIANAEILVNNQACVSEKITQLSCDIQDLTCFLNGKVEVLQSSSGKTDSQTAAREATLPATSNSGTQFVAEIVAHSPFLSFFKSTENENFASQTSAETEHVVKKRTSFEIDLSLVKAEPLNPPYEQQRTSTHDGIPLTGGIPYGRLATLFENIESTTKRLAINEYLSNFYSDLMKNNPESLLPSVYLCINRLGPAYEGIELGLGESLLVKAIAGATGRSAAKVKAEVTEKGDIGLVAQGSKNTQTTLFKPEPLTVCGLYWQLREIATMSGKDSMQRKVDKVKFLLVACQDSESKYLIRSLEGKLRIGLAEQSVLIALAHASLRACPELNNAGKNVESIVPSAVSNLKSVFHELPNYDTIIPKLLKYGVMKLEEHCCLTPGVPLKPMLAHPTRSISEVLDRFEGIPFTCEYKYDGERAQIHRLADGKIMIFSRNCENMTEKYPDVAFDILQFSNPNVESFVLDCEATAWDCIEEKLLPFQILTTRKRKDVKAEEVTVKVCLFVFDLLYFNGKSLLKNSLAERREILHKNFIPIKNKFQFATGMDASKTEEIEMFLDDAIKHNCEGLMVKTLQQDSSYEPSVRSRKWLKVKKDYLEGTGDSLDLVVIGGYLGKGKRKGNYGGYLLACYDADSEEYQAICKIGTGFSDADLEGQFSFFANHTIGHPKAYYKVTEAIKPDVWFEPVQVWEVKAADFSLSPIYTAGIGLVDDEKGISLRFPRFIRIREDKSPDDCTNSMQIAHFYRQQASVATRKNDLADDDMEY